jgi:hypothetical protein
LTWKCASRHNGVHFFDISTSKSGPTMVCFVHFDLEMCIRVLSGDKMYQAMEIEPDFYAARHPTRVWDKR